MAWLDSRPLPFADLVLSGGCCATTSEDRHLSVRLGSSQATWRDVWRHHCSTFTSSSAFFTAPISVFIYSPQLPLLIDNRSLALYNNRLTANINRLTANIYQTDYQGLPWGSVVWKESTDSPTHIRTHQNTVWSVIVDVTTSKYSSIWIDHVRTMLLGSRLEHKQGHAHTSEALEVLNTNWGSLLILSNTDM